MLFLLVKRVIAFFKCANHVLSAVSKKANETTQFFEFVDDVIVHFLPNELVHVVWKRGQHAFPDDAKTFSVN